jgi:hypothetical protein
MAHPELAGEDDPTGIADTVNCLAQMAKAMLPPRQLVCETEDRHTYRQEIPPGFGEAFRERVTMLLTPDEQGRAFAAAQQESTLLGGQVVALVKKAQETHRATPEDEARLRTLYEALRYNDFVLAALGKLTGDHFYRCLPDLA